MTPKVVVPVERSSCEVKCETQNEGLTHPLPRHGVRWETSSLGSLPSKGLRQNWALGGLLEAIEQLEQDQPQRDIHQNTASHVQRLERRWGFEQPVSQTQKEEAVDEDENSRQDETREELIEVELDTGRCGEIPHQRLGHSKDADEAVGKCILQQPQAHSQFDSEDFISAQEPKVNSNQQGKVEKPRQRYCEGQKGLQQEGSEGCHPENRGVHPKNFNRSLD